MVCGKYTYSLVRSSRDFSRFDGDADLIIGQYDAKGIVHDNGSFVDVNARTGSEANLIGYQWRNDALDDHTIRVFPCLFASV